MWDITFNAFSSSHQDSEAFEYNSETNELLYLSVFKLKLNEYAIFTYVCKLSSFLSLFQEFSNLTKDLASMQSDL